MLQNLTIQSRNTDCTGPCIVLGMGHNGKRPKGNYSSAGWMGEEIDEGRVTPTRRNHRGFGGQRRVTTQMGREVSMEESCEEQKAVGQSGHTAGWAGRCHCFPDLGKSCKALLCKDLAPTCL